MKLGFPRTCGDGPMAKNVRERRTAFPPHVRGWTLEGYSSTPYRCVSPARAGMDPSIARTSRFHTRFPRTCGDGPKHLTYDLAAIMFPPHVRGWTLPKTAESERGRVSPARAGMDRF